MAKPHQKTENQKTQQLLRSTKETPEQRRARVVAEGGRFRPRTVPMRGPNQHDRRGDKARLRRGEYD